MMEGPLPERHPRPGAIRAFVMSDNAKKPPHRAGGPRCGGSGPAEGARRRAAPGDEAGAALVNERAVGEWGS